MVQENLKLLYGAGKFMVKCMVQEILLCNVWYRKIYN